MSVRVSWKQTKMNLILSPLLLHPTNVIVENWYFVIEKKTSSRTFFFMRKVSLVASETATFITCNIDDLWLVQKSSINSRRRRRRSFALLRLSRQIAINWTRSRLQVSLVFTRVICARVDGRFNFSTELD